MMMQEISDYVSILGTPSCLRIEMSKALHQRIPAVAEMFHPIIGRGVSHAMGIIGFSVKCGPNITESQKILLQGSLDAWMRESGNWFEFAALACEAVTEGLSPISIHEWRSRFVEQGREFAVAEQKRQLDIRVHAGADRKELDRVTRGVTVLEFWDQWSEVISNSDLDVVETMAAIGDHDVSIIDDVAGLDVISALRAQRFRDEGRPWDRTDFHDVISMQHGIPYCDIVSTDRHWANLANRTHLPSRYETLITGKPAELLEALSAIK
jgi:hypothetical protein